MHVQACRDRAVRRLERYGMSLPLRLGDGSFKVELGPGPFNCDPQNRSTLNDIAQIARKIVQP